MNCSLCDSINAHYKCPTCQIPYCSLKCWKVHKEAKCTKVIKKEEPLESVLKYRSFKTNDTVPIEKLKLLSSSEGVLSTLRNPHVRSMINVIDSSTNPIKVLSEAMHEPIFMEFVEECLKVVEPTSED